MVDFNAYLPPQQAYSPSDVAMPQPDGSQVMVPPTQAPDGNPLSQYVQLPSPKAAASPASPGLGNDFYQNLMAFGLATMAAGSKPGATTFGAIGEGGLGAIKSSREQQELTAKTGLQQKQGEYYGAETQAKKISSAAQLASINMNRQIAGMPPLDDQGNTVSAPTAGTAALGASQTSLGGVPPEVWGGQRAPTKQEANVMSRIYNIAGQKEMAQRYWDYALKAPEGYQVNNDFSQTFTPGGNQDPKQLFQQAQAKEWAGVGPKNATKAFELNNANISVRPGSDEGTRQQLGIPLAGAPAAPTYGNFNVGGGGMGAQPPAAQPQGAPAPNANRPYSNTGERADAAKTANAQLTASDEAMNGARAQNARINQMEQQVAGMTKGTHAQEWTQIKNALQSYLPSVDFSKTVSADQVFDKLAVQLSADATAALGKGEAASVLNTFRQAYPNRSMDPAALKEMLATYHGLNDYIIAHNDAFHGHKDTTGSAVDFATSPWMKGHNPQDFIQGRIDEATGNLPTIVSPSDPAFAKLRPGALFRDEQGETRRKP